MSAGAVDVLAVMDNIACGALAGHDFRMARAAVAELVEAGNRLAANYTIENMRAFKAALARATGAKS